MTLKLSIAIGLMAALPFAALAQRTPSQPDPVDDKAPVPSLQYDSAFAAYVPSQTRDDEATADKNWRAANEKVAQSGGHDGHHADAPKPPAAPVKDTPVDHSNH